MNTRYNTFCAALATTAFLLSLPLTAYAQVTVSLPDLVGGVGAESRIPLAVGNLTGENVDSVSFTVAYDAAVVELTGIELEGTLSEGARSTVDTSVNGQITVTVGADSPFTGGGTLLNIQADLLAEGTSSLEFSAFTLNDGAPSASTTDGSVTVTASARVQFISATSDADLDSVDVYVNGSLLVDDAANPGATDYVTVPADTELELAVAAGDSDSSAEALVSRTETLSADETYVIVLAGRQGSMDNSLRLALQSGARESATEADEVQLRTINAVDDSVRIRIAPGGSDVSIGPDGFSEYLSASASSTVFVTIGSGPDASTFVFNDLSDLAGETLTITAYGAQEVTVNVIAATSGGALVEAAASPTARVQFINAALGAQSDSVDVYVNGERVLNDLARNDATPFVHISSGVELDIVAAAGNSDSAAERLASIEIILDTDSTYVGVLAGDDDSGRPISLFMRNDAHETAASDQRVRFAGFHGAAVGGTLTARIGPAGAEEAASYGAFTDYLSATENAFIDVVFASDAGTRVFRFTDTAAYLGDALTVVTTGSSSADLMVFAATAAGEIIQPDDFVSETARVQLIHNADDPLLDSVDVYVNDSLIVEDVAYQSATSFVNVSAGIPLQVAVAPGNSDSAAEAEATLDITLELGGTYIGVLSGEANADSPDAELDVFVLEDAREEATDDTMVDVVAFNGAVGSTLDLTVLGAASMNEIATVGEDVVFGAFTSYVSINPAPYVVDVSADAGIMNRYALDASELAGESLTLLTSGDVDGTLDLLAVRADGTVVVTSIGTDAEESTELPSEFAIDGNFPNPFNPTTTIRFDLPAQAAVAVEVYDMTGRRVLVKNAGQIAAGTGRMVEIDALSLASGNYVYRVVARTAADQLMRTGTMTLVK